MPRSSKSRPDETSSASKKSRTTRKTKPKKKSATKAKAKAKRKSSARKTEPETAATADGKRKKRATKKATRTKATTSKKKSAAAGPRKTRTRKTKAVAKRTANEQAAASATTPDADDGAVLSHDESDTRGETALAEGDAAREDAGDAREAGPVPAIPPLPEEEDEDEIVPIEEDEEPAPEAPPDASPREILDGIRQGRLHVSALNRLDDDEVAALARSLGQGPPPGERREETLYRLLQAPACALAAQTPTYVEGLLELHPDGYGFLRRPDRSYMQQPDDVYVAAGIIRRLGLRPGHWVSGTARRSRPHEPLLALHRVEEVNHEDLKQLEKITDFENLTVVYPDQRFLLETRPEEKETRVMDLFCPIGRGQRALIVSPPRAGKTIMLQKIADAIAHNSPNVDIVVLLVDERPEEVTNMRRSIRGEVVASTFDRPPANHVRIAELVMEKVKRMVEYGRHVVLLLDSITRLGRAYNNLAGPSGRILTGGLEAKALTKPKRFFGQARNIEDGGSLTIIATSLVDTGSRMDEVIFEEFKGSGNMEVVLDRDLANARIWPAINIPASGTRNEDLLLHPEELRRINLLRKALAGRGSQGVMETLIEMLQQYRTNAELLMSIQ